MLFKMFFLLGLVNYVFTDQNNEHNNEEETHDHAFNEPDTHNHHKDSIEKLSKLDYSKMTLDQQMFYRFKETDIDDDDKIDGVELYTSVYKMKLGMLENSQNHLLKAKEDYEDGDEDESKSKRVEMWEKNVEKSRENTEEPEIIRHIDMVFDSLDVDNDGFITFDEYMPKKKF